VARLIHIKRSAYLQGRGVDRCAHNAFGQTPLEYARQKRDANVVQALEDWEKLMQAADKA
jgi:methylphosphotriester-DNA--protein-cysteine methyltransferase